MGSLATNASGLPTDDSAASPLPPGAPCSPTWTPTFGNALDPEGVNSIPFAMTTFDDGSGISLFVAGAFTIAGGVDVGRIAEWDGDDWTSISVSTDGYVYALEVFDDGDGAALYAAGDFTMIDGVSANRIARWDGVAWSSLGTGLNAKVSDLTVFDNISGPGQALYAAGDFTTAGGVPVSRVARWNGTNWAPVGSGIDAQVKAMTVFDDGSGPSLHIGGAFATAGLGAANRVARLSGGNWVPLAGGVTGGNVDALAVFDDGGGARLYVGGSFTSISGDAAKHRLASWSGSSWGAVGNLNGSVFTLLATGPEAPDGPSLYVGGAFSGSLLKHVARWNGTSLSKLDNGVNATVYAMALFDGEGSGAPELVVGGDFQDASGLAVNRVARWDGKLWKTFYGGLDGRVASLAVYDDGSGNGLYASGDFLAAKGVPVNRIARWDGAAWAPVGVGLGGPAAALHVRGDSLFAGGAFSTAGGQPADRVAEWDGSTWSPLGPGVSGPVFCLSSYDEGGPNGEVLIVGGLFATAGGVPANGIARWDGFTWSPVGDAGNVGAVFALAVFDDGLGGGPKLIAGGNFTLLGGVPVSRIAAWDGVTWSPLGSGTNAVVTALAVTADGPDGGPALYAGGAFTTAGGTSVQRVARWDGLAWTALGAPPDAGVGTTVDALLVHDDGSGPALFVGGQFAMAGGQPASRIARWDGISWSALGSGLPDRVVALAEFDDHLGAGTALIVGGDFVTAPDSGDGYIARWGGCGPPAPGWTNQGSALAGVNGLPILTGLGNLEAGTSNAVNLSNAAPSALSGTLLALSALPVPFKGGTLLPFPFLVLITLPTTPAGGFSLPFGMPVGIPSGTEIWIQAAIQDAAAIKGVALSNALRGLTP